MPQSTILDAALALARAGLPVFPTNDKMPCWSNAELRLQRGDGGYKIASTAAADVRRLFSHERATEIAVPMGAMSGLMCIDVDVHKDRSLREWIETNPWLHQTLTHKTRSGGLHFFFRHPGDYIKFPATLRGGVDIKASGNGYVCWPGTPGYEVMLDVAPAEFPLGVLEAAMKAKGGSGSLTLGSSWNDATDEELIGRIERADELYPALRALSFRLPNRRGPDGKLLTAEQMIEILDGVMATSAAAKPSHARHADWQDRRRKIPDLVLSAVEKHAGMAHFSTEEARALIDAGPPLMDTQKLVSPRPTLRQSSRDDLRLARSLPELDGEFVVVNPAELRSEALPPMPWVVPGVIPAGKVGSIAGASNVGKTYFVAALAVALALGKSELLGLPKMAGKVASMIVANEEDLDDLKYRLKAPAEHYGAKSAANIVLRPSNTCALVLANKIDGTFHVDAEVLQKLVTRIKANNIGVVFFDPYVTLAMGAEENSNDTHPVLTQAFLYIAQETGAAIIHIHHTKKTDGKKDYDSYNGDRDAWRGGGSLFSGLAFGLTLGNWMPAAKALRATWKAAWNNHNLGRFVVLMHAKTKRARRMEPVVYEMIEQPLEDELDNPLPVFQISSEAEAIGALDALTNNELRTYAVGCALVDTFGVGTVYGLAAIHERMQGQEQWPAMTGKVQYRGQLKEVVDCFLEAVEIDTYTVQFRKRGAAKTSDWTLDIGVSGDA